MPNWKKQLGRFETPGFEKLKNVLFQNVKKGRYKDLLLFL